MLRKISGLLIAFYFTAAVWAAFDRPSENDRLRALGNLHEESAPLRKLLIPDDDFSAISPPGRNDWLTWHAEQGQTYEEYCDSKPNKPDPTRKILYLLPIGEFDDETSPDFKTLGAYASSFFQMEVKVLPAHFPHELEFEPRKNPRSGQRQLLTRGITKFLSTQLPADGYCLLGLTMADLYPAPSWNFVFGEASLAERVGIFSLVRYDPAFWGDERGKNFRDVILQRACKVLTHETSHMFGMQHCIYFVCVVNGANHMDETDGHPQHLCPLWLRKMHYATGFDAVKRYRDLAAFYRQQKWFEEFDWVQRQLRRVDESP